MLDVISRWTLNVHDLTCPVFMVGEKLLAGSVMPPAFGYTGSVARFPGRAGIPLRNRFPKLSGNGVPLVLWLAVKVPPGLELNRLVKAPVPSRTNATEKPPRRTVCPELPNSLCRKPSLSVFGLQVMP